MSATIQLGQVNVDVVRKDIKNVHLSVYPPNGRVRIAAPLRMSLDTIRLFAIAKLGWIKQQQLRISEQARETPREYLDRESHYLWGKRYLLKVVGKAAAPRVDVSAQTIRLHVQLGTSTEGKQAILDRWYREQVKAEARHLIQRWEPLLGVAVQRVFVQRMRTKWGSCNPRLQNIRLNTDLAKKPRECIGYIVVHEMTHLLEPTHSARFVALMDQFMPQWRGYRAELNRLPLRHEEWVY
jgi:predicted metal-dependent hydrolase